MPFLGNIVNAVAVIAGGLLGMLLKRGLPQRLCRTLIQAMGLCVIVIGVVGALQNMLIPVALEDGAYAITSSGTMLLIASLVIGTVIGEALNIEDKVEKLGETLRAKVDKGGTASRFTEGFVTSSLTICVGAMAVVGSIADGMGDPSTLFAKAALDFVIVLVYASTMGIGVVFSALPLFVYQSLFVLIGMFAGNVMTEGMIVGLGMVGNVLIAAVGVNLLASDAGSWRIRVGNMLPALFVPIIWELVLMII
ncbi:MAG: DUF554 domain-containing protein [Coriobacteriales bacterium]|nr:DUF554 domain-containing protein [Coriobacteriales bacterium]